MSNTTDKNIEAIEVALVALTAITKSSRLAKQYVDKDGNKMSQEDEIGIIHDIADEAVEALRDYLDSVIK